MFRKECLGAVHGYRVERVTRRVEDYDLFMRLYAAGYRGYNIQMPLLRYTINIQGMKRKINIFIVLMRRGYAIQVLKVWDYCRQV